MIYQFKLPDIGEGVVEGEVVRWLVKEDDLLAQDQPMVEIMTDKATVEIPSPRAGRVIKRMYGEGEICPVGRVLIAIEETGARSAAAAPAPPPSGPVPDRQASATSRPVPAPATGAALATPATRKLARVLGVDIGGVTGTGSGGRVTSEDVRATQAAGAGAGTGATRAGGGPQPPASPAVSSPAVSSDVRIPFRGLRRKIAEHMVRARREAAHFTYVEEVDCTLLVALRDKANERLSGQGLKLSYLPFIVRATVLALQKFPRLNAHLDDKAGEIVERREYHVGIASQTDEGLVVPVIRNAGNRTVVDLAREIDRLAAGARAGKATREELSGSTFTITSLGTLGGVLATPIVNHPEVAILGVHKIAKRPVVVQEQVDGQIEDKIVVRSLMNLSISVDHRIVDGYDAARFVARIKESLESPDGLFEESR